MSINRRIAPVAMAASTFLLQNMDMALAQDCKVISETDTQYGSFAREAGAYLSNVAGVAVCGNYDAAQPTSIPYLLTKITAPYGVKSFRLESPYLYRNKLPANSKFREFLAEAPVETAVQFVCLIENQCGKFFDSGFAVVDEDTDESYYPKFMEIWTQANIEKEIYAFSGPVKSDADEMRKYVNAGGALLPLGLTLDTHNGVIRRIYMWVYGLRDDGTRNEWTVVMEKQGGKFSIVDISLGGSE